MLEGLVSTLLNRFLGTYIRNFDPKQLNVGIFSGDVKFRDLELRREALDQTKLPINVIKGHIGLLTLSIPWSNLKGKPVKVYVEDVFLLAAPKEDDNYDEEEEKRRRQAVKMGKLENAEMLKERTGDGLSQEEQQKSQSFTESLITKIVDNLQISVKNIHVRYEDAISAPGHPFAVGFTLEEFSAISTDESWKPTFIQTSVALTHKVATLGALAIYWNTDTDLLGSQKGEDILGEAKGTNREDILKAFRDMIVRGENLKATTHQFILKPVSGRARIKLDKTGKVDRPKLSASLLFDEIGFIVDEDQYRDALMMVDLFHYFLRHQEYKKYQPIGVTPKEAPRAWLKFAGDAVLSQIHDRNRRWSWDFFKERRDDRQRYIELFKKFKQDTTLTGTEKEEFEKLEWKLSYQDLRFWRSLARNQLRKENASLDKSQEAKKSQGWVAWMWGTGQQQEKEEENTSITEQQKKELYDAIEWDEKAAITESVDLPRETIKLQLEASLQTGSFTLKRDPHGEGTELLSLLFDKFNANILQRPDSFFADLRLGGLRVYDGSTKGTLFPQIVQVKGVTAKPIEERITELEDDADGEGESSRSDAHTESFFQLQFEQGPLDDHADSVVVMKMKSMEVIYNPQFVVGIVNFFKPPERHMESIGALMETAGAKVEGFRQQTRAGLEFALEEHKTVDVKLDLQAPLIIIPQSVLVKDSTCLILDAGHVGMNSELVEKSTIKDIRAKQKTQYSDADYKKLEGLMYDKFLLKLEATQVLIGPSIKDTKSQLNNEADTRKLHIIDRVNIDFIVEISILPKAPNLTKFRVSGHLPVLHASVSDLKYKNLMKVIDVAVPKFEGDDEPRKPKQIEEGELQKKGRDGDIDNVKRPRSKSFQFDELPHDLVMEADTDDEQDEKFVEAPDSTAEEKMKLNQRDFELKFTVDKLQGSLYRADPEAKEPDHLLVELTAEHFQFDLCLRPFDMAAEVLLKSLSIEDFIDGGATPEFKKLVSSEGFESNNGRDLFHVKFMKVNKMSPEYTSVYEGVDTNIDMSVSTINLVITRKSLLTILDFFLITFSNPNPSLDSSNSLEVDNSSRLLETSDDKPADPANDGKMRVKVDLKSVVFILNNDGLRLATLSLNTANISIYIMGKTMQVAARLGDLSLLDDINTGASETSPLRQLVTIEGDELADFRYETFDPDQGENYPGYSSSIFLKSGSIKVNFVEEPFRKIIDFLVKFGKMQAIFNAARQAAANQASQIQENANMMHFDILIKTPILIFPKISSGLNAKSDLITAYLGEIYASNKFVSVDEGRGSPLANKLEAGIRNVHLTSDFHYDDGMSEELEMIDKVDIGFKITYMEQDETAKAPDLEIEGSMTDFNLKITQTQVKFLLELSQTVPAAFAIASDESNEKAQADLSRTTVASAQGLKKQSSEEGELVATDLAPELKNKPGDRTKLGFVFSVDTIGLELILAKEAEPVGDPHVASLSKFSLNETKVKLRMAADSSIESELVIDSFTIRDSRTREKNKFPEIMSSANQKVHQFEASVTISGGTERNIIAILTIDSPRVIFALDYLFAVQKFATTAFSSEESISVKEISNESSTDLEDSDSIESPRPGRKVQASNKSQIIQSDHESSSVEETTTNVAFRVNIDDAQIILIANPQSASSEAIVLGTSQVSISQQHALTLQVSRVGMFLCRMDQFETSRLRILDDFGVQLSMESGSEVRQSSATNIHIDIDPLILRLSLRDILLAVQIVNKASELSGSDEKTSDREPKRVKEIKSASSDLRRRSNSGQGLSTAQRKSLKSARTRRVSDMKTNPMRTESPLNRSEEMSVQLEGFRVVLIGDLHELPLLDFSIKKFNIDVRDWSGQMNGKTNLDMFINIYNFSKSAWEPLIEPWQFGLQLSKVQSPDCLSIEFYSQKMLELTITSATLALASKSAQFLSQDEDDVLSKPRGIDTPFRIRNYTGFDINVWDDNSSDEKPTSAKLSDGEEAPWRFEDWEKMRENLAPEGGSGVIGLKLEGSGFNDVTRIPVNKEGESIYSLRPRKDKTLHRLLVEVELAEDNVKYITFRSPLLIENNTQIPVEIGIFNHDVGDLLKIEKIQPGQSRPAPVGSAFEHSILVRPDQGFGYTWSSERIFWEDLLKRPTKTMTCKSDSGDKTPPFYFQMNANFDKKNPLTRYDQIYFSRSGGCL